MLPAARRLKLWRAAVGAGAVAAAGSLALAFTSSPAVGADTCPGRNGRLAVVTYLAGERDGIGLLTNKRKVRTVYKGVGGNSLLEPTFSCDGRWIAFTEIGGNPSPGLVILRMGGRARFLPIGRMSGSAPAFLRSGRIVFSGKPEGRHPRRGTFLVARNGAGLRRLFWRRELAVSAHGRWFVATDPRGTLHRLYLLDRRGRIVRSSTPPAPAGSEYLNPQFCPNGRWIVFEERTFGVHIHDVIYAVRRDGGRLRRLTRGPQSASEPAFSPDGRWVVFTLAPEGTSGGIFALSFRNAQTVRRLAPSSGYQ